MSTNEKAAPLVQSERGHGIDHHAYSNMTAPAVQPHCTPMPAQGFTAEQRAEQLRLFALDGAWAEPYVARANSKAAKAVGRGGRRWV